MGGGEGEQFLRLTYAKSYKYFDKGCLAKGLLTYFADGQTDVCAGVCVRRVGCLIHITTFKLSLFKLKKLAKIIWPPAAAKNCAQNFKV